MKKVLLIGLAATAMLASCSNDETVEMAQPKAIGFSNVFVDNATRAAEDPSYTITDGAPNSWNFAVWGYEDAVAILDKEVVSYVGNGWGYASTAYWAVNKDYNFYAMAPSSEKDKVTVTKNGVSAITNFVNVDVNQKDLLYAKQSVAKMTDLSNVQPVNFSFEHLLSKVKFTFINSLSNDLMKIKVVDIKINNPIETATATYANNDWTWNEGTRTNLTLNFGETTEISNTGNANRSECANEKLLIPGKGIKGSETSDGYKITFTVQLLPGNETNPSSTFKHTVFVDETLVKGHCYNFVATINDENLGGDDSNNLKKIQFTVEKVEAWSSETDKEILVTETVTE